MGIFGSNWIGYAVFALTAAVCLVVGALCIFVAVRLIRRQIKLHHSIRLVELRSIKIHYVFFMILDFGCAFSAVLTLLGGYPKEYALLQDVYAMPRPLVAASLICLTALAVVIAFLLAVLFTAKSAVVDKGIYTASNYLDWYHVHDYIIDESTGSVTLSTCRDTFATIRGTTSPLKVAKNDIPKLKFILNKNKNKFSA